ncbi:hypothetical protein OXC43_gp64 [Klebsiella phage vB_KpP_FBKp27]|uniref:Uncharacterized protein n=1 Tax=Klebsiella phage vB_KpP_FBKp27 TaxID=2801837 RepID=A0A7U0J5S6_9CAUD|nr:hypothetical protein OXC43_gp64 [Klebsiella phage vB_KpP_FBKp27]QQV91645.1 hypothetical protein vBKpPFBKp27_055 [Klebsiella phage vB_KpP_FBKp27]
MVPKGTVNRIKTANAIGIQELELKPVTVIAAVEGQFEVIHKNSIPGIELDLDSAPLGWIYWKPGNEEQPGYASMRDFQREMIEEVLRRQEINNPKQFISDRSIQETKSTSDIADAFNFFNKIYSDNTKL